MWVIFRDTSSWVWNTSHACHECLKSKKRPLLWSAFFTLYLYFPLLVWQLSWSCFNIRHGNRFCVSPPFHLCFACLCLFITSLLLPEALQPAILQVYLWRMGCFFLPQFVEIIPSRQQQVVLRFNNVKLFSNMMVKKSLWPIWMVNSPPSGFNRS